MDKYTYFNKTHCGMQIFDMQQKRCRECLNDNFKCIDFDNDGKTDDCSCPKNEDCKSLNIR
jgi:hypothetical protein